MKSWTQKSLLMWLLLVTMLVMLPLLAVLQYRWLGEVSQAERERMQANLKTSAERFCADFDRELTSIYTQIQRLTEPGFNKPADILSADFANRYNHWLANNPQSRLVGDLYRTGFDDQGKLALALYKTDSGQFELISWPEKLIPLRLRLEAQQQAQKSAQTTLRNLFGSSEQPHLPGGGQGIFLQIQSGVIADELPALIVPDAHPHKLNPILDQKSFCTVVLLRNDFIKNELLPSLAKRHFSANGRAEFNLAIVRRSDAKNVVYQSDASLSANAFEKSDAQASLFKIRLDEADRFLIRNFGSETVPMPASPAPETLNGDRKVTMRVMRSEVFQQSNKVQIGIASTDKIALAGQLPSLMAENEGWRLLVKHRAGSLEAAVGNVRRRNLAISFGILLLLGGSVGFIVLSSRRAERLAAQQMEFVAGVSHELRTPLAVICSAAENLADGVIDNRDQIKRYGGLIRDEGRRLTGMVEQVLEFAGAQSGRKTYELRPTDLNHVIEDAIAACHLQLVEGGFELEKNIPAELPAINADAAALSRALQNLLNNAMKYSGDSRWIGLSAEWGNFSNCPEVRIKVSDRGLGIAPAELPHIFEPFYRGKEIVASQIHGNGLGLSLVKHIVDEHGGDARVESKVGQGSNFMLSLPIIPVEEPFTETPREAYEQTHLAR